MASAIYPQEPGTEYGPCRSEQCGHLDCEQSRRDAAKICRICGKAIGYGNRVYAEFESNEIPNNEGFFVHARCLESEAKRKR